MSTALITGYVALVAALFTVCLGATPGWAALAWVAIGLVSATTIVIGVRRNAPLNRWPWWLLAGTVLAMATGDATYEAHAGHHVAPPPAVADACYIAMFPLIMASLTMLTRASRVLGDRARLLDLLALTCIAGLAAWVFLIGPGLSAPHLSAAERSMLAGYVLGDLLILIVALRLLLAARRSWSVFALAIGACGLLTSTVTYTLAQIDGGWSPDQPGVLGYLVVYLAWGSAALHPSMVELTAPVDPSPPRLRARWATRLRLCLAIPPIVMIIEAVTGHVRDGVVIAIVSVLLSEIVITQLVDVVGKHRRAVARERGLREVCGALVAAVDVDEVYAAVRAAMGRLVPAGVPHVVLLITDVDRDRLPGPDTLPVPATGRGSRLVPTRLLHPELRYDLDAGESTLVCPLLPVGGRWPAQGPTAGTLLVNAPGRVLTPVRDSVEVLAAQVTLALERIALTEIVNRRDGEQYLEAVVQNTADIVLVVDADGRIRYASPSLTTVLSLDPAGYQTLFDLVHPDDHEQVVRTRQLAELPASRNGAQDVWSLRRPDGSRVLVEINYRDLRGDRLVRGFVITMRDVSERHAAEQDRIRQALRQSGGWQNRRSLHSRFK